MDDDMKKCAKCGGNTAGYKCEDCAEESAEPDQNHACGGGKCQPKCAACNQAETKCEC